MPVLNTICHICDLMDWKGMSAVSANFGSALTHSSAWNDSKLDSKGAVGMSLFQAVGGARPWQSADDHRWWQKMQYVHSTVLVKLLCLSSFLQKLQQVSLTTHISWGFETARWIWLQHKACMADHDILTGPSELLSCTTLELVTYALPSQKNTACQRQYGCQKRLHLSRLDQAELHQRKCAESLLGCQIGNTQCWVGNQLNF